MIADINKVIMSGAISSEIRNISKLDDKLWVAFQLAVTERFTVDAEPTTALFDVIIFDKSNAEFAMKELKERDIILIEGKLLIQTKKQKNGFDKQSTRIVNGFAQTIRLLSSASPSSSLPGRDDTFDDDLPF